MIIFLFLFHVSCASVLTFLKRGNARVRPFRYSTLLVKKVNDILLAVITQSIILKNAYDYHPVKGLFVLLGCSQVL